MLKTSTHRRDNDRIANVGGTHWIILGGLYLIIHTCCLSFMLTIMSDLLYSECSQLPIQVWL